MKIKVLDNKKQIGKYVARYLADQIDLKKKLNLGLATGSSPIETYKELINISKFENLDFKNVKTFNLDEYLDLDENDPNSYSCFMKQNLFNEINIKLENTFIPNNNFANNPHKYDELIEKHGGIDIQILGVGSNGHIGFNEPGSSFDSLTSIVNLAESTIKDNSRFFDDIKKVPKRAISMGIKSIMNAKEIILIAFGENKRKAIYELLYGPISTKWPCTILKEHKNLKVIIDKSTYGPN